MSGLIRTRGGWPSLLLLKGDGLDDASRRLPSVSSFKPPAVTVVSKSSTGAGGWIVPVLVILLPKSQRANRSRFWTDNETMVWENCGNNYQGCCRRRHTMNRRTYLSFFVWMDVMISKITLTVLCPILFLFLLRWTMITITITITVTMTITMPMMMIVIIRRSVFRSIAYRMTYRWQYEQGSYAVASALVELRPLLYCWCVIASFLLLLLLMMYL